MLTNIGLGALMTIATVVIHALCTAAVIAFLRTIHVDHWALRTLWTRVGVISGLVVALLLVSVLEASLWAAVYMGLGTMQDFAEALDCSLVTFTTLGYGDVTLGDQWRLLGSIEAAGGSITFGWTTALIVAASHRMVARNPES
jgi:hypothetical protein